MKYYPAAKPHMTKLEERYVLKVLRSGVLSIGPFIERFEHAFARKVGARYACAVSNGTTGLHLALIAAGVKEGDEVITSPFSFVASANAILYVGAKPVFADIDPVTYNIDPTQIERHITSRTKAILPVHIFGQPAAMTEIMLIAKKYRLVVIEDACESLLAKYQGRRSGTFGTAGVFSFYPNKQMTTGEGGVVVTNKKSIDALCRSLRNQGRGSDRQWLDHARLGYNYRLSELSAAVGLAQLERLDFLMKKRREIATWYTQALVPLRDQIILPETGRHATHTWFVYTVRIKDHRIKRDEVIDELARAGIGSKPYLPSIHLLDFYRKRFGFKRGSYPVSERVSDSTLTLPLYIGITKKDVRRIVQTLREILEKCG